MVSQDFDLWAGEDIALAPDISHVQLPSAHSVYFMADDNNFYVVSDENLTETTQISSVIPTAVTLVTPRYHMVSVPKTRGNAFGLFFLVKGFSVGADDGVLNTISTYASQCHKPTVSIAPSGKSLDIFIPNLAVYRDVVTKLGAYYQNVGHYRLSITRVLDLRALADNIPDVLPPLACDDKVLALTAEPIEGFNGSVEDLKTIPVSVLNTISSQMPSRPLPESSRKKTIVDNLESFGISTLYDLLFHVPRRYIDKSKPQDIHDVMFGETATVVGIIESVETLSNNTGVVFVIRQEATSRPLRVTFFRQIWLANKFSTGDNVLITGKLNYYHQQLQLVGASIEHAEEAAILPIVPVYNQSASKNVTTKLLVNALREMFARLQAFYMPSYLHTDSERMDYNHALTALHFPSSMEENTVARESLAFYELVYMQVLIQHFMSDTKDAVGVVSERCASTPLQELAIAALPYTMTNAQVKAVETLNEQLALPVPSSHLLSAEVGAGKTLVAQLACLRVVEGGHQAIMVAPTEILAQQLYNTFCKVIEPVSDHVNIEFVKGSQKAAQRRSTLQRLASGEIDIAVGTHTLLSESVGYKDLGFVCFDEQQKFGTEQRTSIFNRREDKKIPDLLMASATPIPRSTAQIYYGGIGLLELNEKPPGRQSVTTQWIQQNPREVIGQGFHEMWADIVSEAQQGSQTFIITPLVDDSSAIEAASVKGTHAELSTGALSQLSVGMVHGKMKPTEQSDVMEKFSRGEIDVLVASTIVEVGVDVPNATRVVVLSAERLGASSLHQIRGRVGRGHKASHCYLVSLGESENSQRRLQALVDTDNGFEIAEVDLETRGEGTVFGSSQSKSSDMKFASITTHRHVLTQSAQEATRILSSPDAETAIKDAQEMFGAQGRVN